MRDYAANVPGSGPPWTAPGWLETAEHWLRSRMDTLGRPLTGPVRQVHAWELSSVLRAPTTRGDVYFKATADSPLFDAPALPLLALALMLWLVTLALHRRDTPMELA